MTLKRLNRLIVISAVLGLITTCALAAEETQTMEEIPLGFSGTLFMGGVYSNGDLSLEDASEDDNKTISSLGQSPKSSSGGEFILGGELNYLFSTGTMVSLLAGGDSAMNMEGGFGLGISQYAGEIGTFSLSGYYSDKDVWADPFVTGADRSKTDHQTIGMLISWDEVMETDFSLRYGYEDVNVDNDISGKRDNLLNRNGNIHHFGIDYGLFSNGTHEMSTGLIGEIGDMDGKAYAFKGGELGLSHILHGNNWELETGIAIGKRNYDEIHPHFGKKREDIRYGIETAYTLYNLFGLENYFVSLFAGYDKVDSNIGFYDQSVWTAGAGVGLRF